MGEEKPIARIIREHQFAVDVARKAIALRRIGKAADEYETTLAEYWKKKKKKKKKTRICRGRELAPSSFRSCSMTP